MAFVIGGEEPQVEIKVRDRGPYKVTGPIRLVDADRRIGMIEVSD